MVPDVKGKAPTKLVVKDIKVGHGAPAKAGDNVVVKYVGVACSTGKAFDASYTDPTRRRRSFRSRSARVRSSQGGTRVWSA